MPSPKCASRPWWLSTAAVWRVCLKYCPETNHFLEKITMKIETIAVHGGYTPDPTTKAVAVPIYQTVAYAFDNTQHGADLFDLKIAGNIYSLSLIHI